jgi:hypothetical protein
MDVWSFSDALFRRLLLWSALSVVLGLKLASGQSSRLRAMGQQFVAWGGIDGAIALVGRLLMRRRRRLARDPDNPELHRRQAVKIGRLLWTNAGLDVLYVLVGAALMQTRGRRDAKMHGHGLGVTIQGGFLLAFDLWHALQTRRKTREDRCGVQRA